MAASQCSRNASRLNLTQLVISDKDTEHLKFAPTGVNEGVLLHVRLLMEPLAAIRTRKGSGVAVYQQVS